MTRRVITALILGAALILAGCGYHLKGAGLEAPEGVETMAIPVLKNRTAEPNIENTFTGDLIYEFTRSKIVGIVDESQADAVLTGVIQSLDVSTVSHTRAYDSDVQRVKVKLDLKLKKADGTVLWAVKGISDNESFQVSDDKRVTEFNKTEALGLISERIAEKVHTRIFEDF
jgi:outer membrane lipopolysaccharide assembly protein LptE/RlpB